MPREAGGAEATRERCAGDRCSASLRSRTLAVVIVLVLGATPLLGGCESSGGEGAVSHRPWATTVLARHLRIGPHVVALPGSPDVVGSAPDDCHEPCPFRLERLDLTTDRVRGGSVLSSATSLVALPHGLALLTAPSAPLVVQPGAWFVSRLSVSGLEPGALRRVRLPLALPPAVAARGTSRAVWMGAGQRLALVALRTGRALITVPVPFDVLQAAVSPDGRRLYVVGVPHGEDHADMIEEYGAEDGRLLTSVRRRFAGDFPVLTASNTGVWVAPGNAPAQLLGERGLRPRRLSPGAVPPSGRGAYQDTVTDLGAFVLVQSRRGMTCLSPSGRLRGRTEWASARQAPSWTPIRAEKGRLLALGLHYPRQPHGGPVPADVGVLFSVHLPAACFG